jgi:hypothetical protein
MGLLHPPALPVAPNSGGQPAQSAMQGADTVGAEIASEEVDEQNGGQSAADSDDDDDQDNDFDVTSPDVRHPSTMGVSFCVSLSERGAVVVRLPQLRKFSWQPEDSLPFPTNGRYESCTRLYTSDSGNTTPNAAWKRCEALLPDTVVQFSKSEFSHGHVVRKDVQMPQGSPVSLRVELFPRKLSGADDLWLLTIILRNTTNPAQVQNAHESVLYQSLFEVLVKEGFFEKYPESRRPFGQLDSEEQSLALLYRESATWGIGHGCAAGWDAEPDQRPDLLYADVMPAVELPSMTPDIELNGSQVRLSMRELANLSDNGSGPAWQRLEDLQAGYGAWMNRMQVEAASLNPDLRSVAERHLAQCNACHGRINAGIQLLRSQDENGQRARKAFRLANLAMLLQQIGTKQLSRRPLGWNSSIGLVMPQGNHVSPWSIYQSGTEDAGKLGSWRAFQIAFLLMSLNGVRDGSSPDRTIVDLVWFPTGGGKTEAYLAVVAFYLFHERLLMTQAGPKRDGTNVLMRYTLRMLTTQQFQRAASLICAMEFIRRNPALTGAGTIAGRRFSLGLWIGGDGSPNSNEEARIEVNKYRRGDVEGNPLVLTECPWCRSEIGRYNGPRPKNVPGNQWNATKLRGISADANNSPVLHCPDPACSYGQVSAATWLPIEVIDERLYESPPSMVIATADKLAMISYRPAAGALFGRRFVNGNLVRDALPPGLIIQDELHLISGPLGTMYALYEGVFERLCSVEQDGQIIKPKLIASTATIRGAADQVRALYARSEISLFPTPGLKMGDSFFGKYARDASGKLRSGRLYLGIHANDYGSVLTTQVRTFSAALFRPFRFDAARRDPWWTLLAFYNSIRELGGAKTLFDSDIRSRLKFMFNREGFLPNDRRNIRIVEELTSRLSQADIVGMMDRLSLQYSPADGSATLDACLASNIIEVGVDIDRLSLMGVIGQPKTTATYIQVTGRVGRRWSERPGLILMIYNPSKSRDRSHFEQFHSYHRRLYERVEPTTATPFALSALERGLAGALLAWSRQQSLAPVQAPNAYESSLDEALELFQERCESVSLDAADRDRSLAEINRLFDELKWKWQQNPQEWEKFPPNVNGQYLMLWPGQYYTGIQKVRGATVPSSMRQVDRSAELSITQGYVQVAPAPQQPAPPTSTP